MDKVFTVTELTSSIKEILEDSFLDLWVEGEISNFIHHSSGHMYFTVKDKNSQLQVVMFRSACSKLKFTVENGMEVTLRGRISVYEKRGSYQFYAEAMEPQGLGALQLAFEQLKEKLLKEGLFDESRKVAIPRFPKTIGVVTSPTGAAIRDILHVIDRRFSNVRVVLFPVKVQGDAAASEIANAISSFAEWGECDVLIVGRGGGSLEDLWAFNEEIVARAIYDCDIPIISAVGHEIDFTISDFVSDLRAPTPSAAAELVVVNKADLEETLKTMEKGLFQSIQTVLDRYKLRLDNIKKRYSFVHPLRMLEGKYQQLDDLYDKLKLTMNNVLSNKSMELKQLVGKLNVLSPLSVLSRGYSVNYDSKSKIIKSAKSIAVGDVISTKVSDGDYTSEVLSIELK